MGLRPRIARRRVLLLARRFPAITILGARQIGKSTLARQAFPDFAYLDLEHPVDFARADADLALLLSQHQRLVFDEAQRLPALFPALRSFLDAEPRRRVVLLGSAAPGLLSSISESLTGRVGIFELSGISIFEHYAESLWSRAGFPGSIGVAREPDRQSGTRRMSARRWNRTSRSSASGSRACGCETSSPCSPTPRAAYAI